MANQKVEDLKSYYVQESYSQETGGGFMCDVFLLNDGTVLVIGEDSIVLYDDEIAWEEKTSQQRGFIIRSAEAGK